MEESKLKALISLLDDLDREVVEMVEKTLHDEGLAIIPELEKAWEYSISQSFQEHIENIIEDIQSRAIRNELGKWVNEGSESLLKGAFLIAKHQYPDYNYDELNEFIERISRDVWLEINENLTALEKVRIINQVMYEMYDFAPNSTSLLSVNSSYINQVSEFRRGNAISLGIIYIALAERLELPIRGVNLPNNFILAYMDEFNYGSLFKDNILFYIDPLSKGTVLGRHEIDHYLAKIKVNSQPKFYIPCTNISIIQRLTANLIYSYDKDGLKTKVEQLKELLRILDPTNTRL